MTLEHIGYAQHDHKVWTGVSVRSVTYYDAAAVMDWGGGIVSLVIESSLSLTNSSGPGRLVPFRVITFRLNAPEVLIADQQFTREIQEYAPRSNRPGMRTLAIGSRRVLLLSAEAQVALATWNGVSVNVSVWTDVSHGNDDGSIYYYPDDADWAMSATAIELVVGPNGTYYVAAWGRGLALRKLAVTTIGVGPGGDWIFPLNDTHFEDMGSDVSSAFGHRNLLHLVIIKAVEDRPVLVTLRFDGGGHAQQVLALASPNEISRASAGRDAVRVVINFTDPDSAIYAQAHILSEAASTGVRIGKLPPLPPGAIYERSGSNPTLGGHVAQALPGPMVSAFNDDTQTQSWVAVAGDDTWVKTDFLMYRDGPDDTTGQPNYIFDPRVAALASRHLLVVQAFSWTVSSSSDFRPVQPQAIVIHVLKWSPGSSLEAGGQRRQGYFVG